MNLKPKEKGQSLIELLVALSVFVLAVSVITWLVLDVYLADRVSRETMTAVFLAQEGMEAVKSIRDNNWNDLVQGTHGLAILSNQWAFQGTQESESDKLNEGIRQIIIEEAGQNRKKITSQVSWQILPQRQGLISFFTYLTNWLAEALGNWLYPVQEASLNISGAQDGLKIKVQGDYAYLVRNDGTPDFLIINIQNPASPLISGSLSLAGAPTNLFIQGNYVYISSANDAQELQIINISNPSSPVISGVFNAAGTADANDVFLIDNTLYLIRDSSTAAEFLIINVLNPSLPVLMGSLDLGATANEIFVKGDYAFLASAHNGQELQVVNLNNPASPILAGYLNLSGTSDALSIAGFNDAVLIGRADGFLYLINALNPGSPALLSSFSSGGAVNDISLGNNYAFLATGAGAAEFQVIDISNLTSPSPFSSLNLASPLNGIFYDSSKNRVFLASRSNSEEFIIVKPQ